MWNAWRFTRVQMRPYTEEELQAYVGSGTAMDKAGAYGVQDAAFMPAASVDGCYTNVMGLPLCLVVDMLRDSGYKFTPQSQIKVPDECWPCSLKGSP